MQAVGDSCNYLTHKRSIVYLNTDLLSLLPEGGLRPAALRWEGTVLASNELARSYGVIEPLPLGTAAELCPGLKILGPEHIPQLNEAVKEVNAILSSFSHNVERIGLDDCYIELTDHPLVVNAKSTPCRGYGKEGCGCGCSARRCAARQLAIQLQSAINSTLNMRCRVGVSSCKLLARLAALRDPAGQCRFISPEDAKKVLEFEDVRLLFPGFLASALRRKGIQTTEDIRKMTMDQMRTAVGFENAMLVKKVACGVDMSPVIPSDMWRLLCLEFEVREKFCILLLRLLAQVEDDGRTPLAVKVSVRKVDPLKHTCSKETKTAPIPCGAIGLRGRVAPETVTKLLGVVMGLFYRLVDTSRPFQLSLLGLAFVRFHDTSFRMSNPSVSPAASRSMASCLLRKRELSVETPLNLSFEGNARFMASGPAPQPVVHDPSELDDLTPCEKKAKLDIIIKAQKLQDDEMDLESPSRLRVADLSLSDDVSPNPCSRLHC